MLYFISLALIRIFFRIMGKITYIGTENIPKTGGVILAPNHISYADPPVVGFGVHRQVHFMAKEELFKAPVSGAWIRSVGSFPVRRGAADRRALKCAIDMLNEGGAVCLFPEGTRSIDGKLQEPELGIGMIALKTRAPVVPVAIMGTDKVLPIHAKYPHRHPMKVIYGKPLEFRDLYDIDHTRHTYKEVGRRIMTAIADLLLKHAS